MITEKDLQEAIAECQGVKNPTASTCIKMAAFYIIKDHLYGDKEVYSFAGPQTDEVKYESETDFGRAISGRDINEILPLVDELMTTLQAVNPRLYNGVMRRL